MLRSKQMMPVSMGSQEFELHKASGIERLGRRYRPQRKAAVVSTNDRESNRARVREGKIAGIYPRITYAKMRGFIHGRHDIQDLDTEDQIVQIAGGMQENGFGMLT